MLLQLNDSTEVCKVLVVHGQESIHDLKPLIFLAGYHDQKK